MVKIKVTSDGKGLKKKVDEVFIPLAGEDAGPAERVLHVETMPSERSKRLVNVFLLIMALLVLSAGMVGGVYIYKYMARRHKVSRVTLQYVDDTMPTPLPSRAQHQPDLFEIDEEHKVSRVTIQYVDGTKPTPLPSRAQHQPDLFEIDEEHKVSRVTIQYVDDTMPTPLPSRAQRQPDLFEIDEEVDILVEQDVERIDVPKFDDCRSSVVIHDFHTNTSVIVDKDDLECFIMDLDRSQMSPPRSFAELITKYASGYYMPKVDVVRRNYHVMVPPLQDLTFAGTTIANECLGYTSYKLEKNEPATMLEIQFYLRRKFKTFGYTDLRQVIKDQIFK